MFSRSSKYAIKGVLYIALNATLERKILAKDIAKPINAPASYIAKILQELSRHNVISSSKGPGGGFFPTQENLETPLINIVEIIDGGQRLRSCMLSIGECDSENPCPLHDLVGTAKSDFIKNLEEHTIEDLLVDVRLGKSHLPL